jgi:hypothetical protein
MKTILFTLSLTLTCFFATAQFFEGKVVYHNTFKSKTATLTDDQMTSMMGAVQNWYIKDGEYKSETNGTVVQWQLYVNADNKLYTKMASSETILWNDCVTNDDQVISAEINKDVATILGYRCNELVLTCKSGIQKYYFTSKLPVDTKLYANHQYGNWYSYLQKANAVPLKMIVDNAQLTMESVATEVKPLQLDKSMFTLPANVKTMKSPY